MALEPEFWSALSRIAAHRGRTLAGLVASADAGREPTQPLASALRVMALRVFDPESETPQTRPPAGEEAG